MKKTNRIILLVAALLLAKNVQAASLNSLKGFSVSSPLKINLQGEIKDLSEEIPSPWGMRRLSPIYQYDISNAVAEQKFNLSLSYKSAGAPGSNELKAIFFYDKKSGLWKMMNSQDYPQSQEVKAETSLVFAPVAIFSYPLTKAVGQATWYSYKKGLYAASPDFPKGTKLKVTNTANKKSVVVTVNDYGPDRRLHPQRVIDLDKVAFQKIANLSAGVINVTVAPVETKSYFGPKKEFIPRSQAVALYDTKNQTWLYEYRGDKVLPLASLSKIVAIKTFLDIPGNRDRLEEAVNYSLNDEKLNYQYCNPWESARLRMKDQDTLTIKDLIYSALVGSANNAVETLVRHSGLSREEFIARMNSWAKEQGALSSTFVEPTGLSPQNVTTAKDYALMSAVALSDPLVAVPASSLTYSFKAQNDNSPHKLKNTNPLLGSFKYSFFASKTGYLHEAAHCLMMGAHAKNSDIIVVVLGAASQAQSISDMEELLKYGLMVAD